MKRQFEWPSADAMPLREEVLRLQGIPGDRPLSPRIETMISAARSIFAGLAEPRAIAADISEADFAHVYWGEGRNSHSTPLELVFPRAGRLVLFAATLGARVTEAIRDLFASRDLALASMLDSVASAAADRLATLPRLVEFAGGGRPGVRVLAYSPGYCGWDVTGQRALFAALKPEAIGITLNSGCLMHPLKSVSGVLAAGPASAHKFQPTFSFCASCREKQCRDRMALVLRRETEPHQQPEMRE